MHVSCLKYHVRRSTEFTGRRSRLASGFAVRDVQRCVSDWRARVYVPDGCTEMLGLLPPTARQRPSKRKTFLSFSVSFSPPSLSFPPFFFLPLSPVPRLSETSPQRDGYTQRLWHVSRKRWSRVSPGRTTRRALYSKFFHPRRACSSKMGKYAEKPVTEKRDCPKWHFLWILRPSWKRSSFLMRIYLLGCLFPRCFDNISSKLIWKVIGLNICTFLSQYIDVSIKRRCHIFLA